MVASTGDDDRRGDGQAPTRRPGRSDRTRRGGGRRGHRNGMDHRRRAGQHDHRDLRRERPLDPGDLPAVVASAAVVLCQLEIPVDVVRAAAEQARGSFVLNAAPAAALPDESAGPLRRARRQRARARRRGRGRRRRRDRLRRHRLGAPEAARPRRPRRRHHPRGRGRRRHRRRRRRPRNWPHRRPTVVDTTGAGDAFVGVLAARLAAGDTLVDASRWGVVAGSLAVRGAARKTPTPISPPFPTQSER